MSNSTLGSDLYQAISAALETGAVDRSAVRQIIVGPAPDFSKLLIHVSDSWDSYGAPSGDAAIGEVSLADWLSAIDRLPEGAPLSDVDTTGLALSLRLDDPLLQRGYLARLVELRSDIHAALRDIGREQRVGALDQCVGLYEYGYTVSSYADLVAFYHPLGAEPLWPIHEHVHPSTDTYSWGTLQPDGVTMFYPEGDGDGLSEDKQPSLSRRYLFADMQSVRVDDGDIHFRLQGDLFDIRLSNGHCHEEFGGPSSEDVGAALAAHFMPHVKEPPAAPAVENGDTEWGRLADACAEAGQDEEALRLLENISPKRRDGFHWREELTALLRLGRFDEAIARADALGKRDEDAPLKVAPFAALALCALGRHADALKRLTRPKDGKVRDTERWDFAHAVALQSDAEALPMLDRALATNDQFLRLGFGRFVTAPALVASLQKREALTAAARRRPWPRADLACGVLPTDWQTLRDEARTLWAVTSEQNRSDDAQGVSLGQYRYVAEHNFGVCVFDGSTRIRRTPQLCSESMSEIAISSDLLVLAGSRALALFSLTDPARPEQVATLSTPEGTNVQAVGLAGHHLYVAAGSGGLLIADVSQPSSPTPIAQLKIDGVKSCDGLWMFGDLAAIGVEGGVCLVDVREPAGPKSIGLLRGELNVKAVVRRDDSVLVIADTSGYVAWTFDLTSRAVTSAARLLGERGYDLTSARLDTDGTLEAMTSENLVTFAERPEPARPDITPHVRAQKPALVERLRDALAKFDGTIGAISVFRWGSTFRVSFVRPCSLPALLMPSAEAETIELPPAPSFADDDYNVVLAMERHAERVWSAMLGEAFDELRATEVWKQHASGRVYLCLNRDECRHVIGIVQDTTRPWHPARAEVLGRRKRTWEELFADYREVERLRARAKIEPEVRQAAFELAGRGMVLALRVVESVEEIDPDGAIASYKAALSTGLAAQAVTNLAPHLDRHGIREAIEAKLTSAEPHTCVEAAVALGRCDDDSIVNLTKFLLEDEHADTDLIARALAPMRRLPELLPQLRGWIDRADASDPRIGLIAPYLFHAGEPQLPQKIVAAAQREKRDEQYHDMKTGIAVLDGASSQHPVCAAERLWTGKRLADHVAQLMHQGDTATALVPADMTEPFPASWNYLLAAAWPHLDKAFFEATLCAHARPDERYAADRTLLERLWQHHLVQNDVDAALRLGEAMLHSPDGTFDKASLRRIRSRLQSCLIVKGFALIKTGAIAEARVVANAALSSDPEDGQTLFLDARLCWLEGTPQDCIARAQAALPRVSASDEAGRGRLLNLIGCAYDALSRWSEALPFFEQAAKAHAEDPMYLANIAECHEKLGHRDDAVKWATQARRKGAKVAAVQRILGD